MKRPKKGPIVPILGPFWVFCMVSVNIGDALFTKTQQKLLALLYGRPDKSFYTNEIVRWAEMGRGTICRELESFVSAGLLTVKKEGNQLYYRANSDNPIYNELITIVKKTFGIVDVVKHALSPIYEQVDYAFIYGSVAKGEDSATSDIDLMVVAENLAYADLMAVLEEAEQAIGRPVNPTIYSKAQIDKKLQEKNAFISRVMEQPKIWIKVGNDVA